MPSQKLRPLQKSAPGLVKLGTTQHAVTKISILLSKVNAKSRKRLAGEERADCFA